MSGMGTEPERRRVMRLDVLRQPRGGELEPHFVHLLDLSPLGVRIAHLEPWHEGVVCSVELPPAVGALRLPGRVVWTRLRETERIVEGDRRSLYESGVEFTRLTAEQQAALALALATFRAAQAGLGDAAVPTDTPPQGTQGSST
jgi:PilZ domain